MPQVRAAADGLRRIDPLQFCIAKRQNACKLVCLMGSQGVQLTFAVAVQWFFVFWFLSTFLGAQFVWGAQFVKRKNLEMVAQVNQCNARV